MKTIKIPGAIDPHVHMRDPGTTQKEDFTTGTQAAIAGGVVAVLDMPNNPDATITKRALARKKKIAEKKAVCDYGFIFGASQDNNTKEFPKVVNNVFAIKVFMNATTGDLLLQKLDILEKVFKAWPKEKPIMVHAEDSTLAKAIGLAAAYGKRLHVVHLSQQSELEMVMAAKERGLPVTCETAVHYLYLTDKDIKRFGGYSDMLPALGPKSDQNFLWKHLDAIDCLATDHAPHTRKEKESKERFFGITGLETALPLMLNAVNKGMLKLDDVVRLTHEGPKRIFGLDVSTGSYVEVNLKEKYTIDSTKMFTKSKWSLFDGMKIRGKIKRVFIRGKEAFADGEIKVKPGFGKLLKPEKITIRNKLRPVFNRRHVLLSIGRIKNKRHLLPYIKDLYNQTNHVLYATKKTHNFLQKNDVKTTFVYKVSKPKKEPNISTLMEKNVFDLVINIATHDHHGSIREQTDGRLIRSKAIESGTTLVTDVDVAVMVINKLAQ